MYRASKCHLLGTVSSDCTHIEGGPGWARDHSQPSEILSRYFSHTIFVRTVLFAVSTVFKLKLLKHEPCVVFFEKQDLF